MEVAVERAKARLGEASEIHKPTHPKSFVAVLEEASRETDGLLHDMWTNLLASQLSDDICHPHYIEILKQFSPSEARILNSLLSKQEIGETRGGYFFSPTIQFEYWVQKADGEMFAWETACQLLRDFGLADVTPPPNEVNRGTTLLFRTEKGDQFIRAASHPGSSQ